MLADQLALLCAALAAVRALAAAFPDVRWPATTELLPFFSPSAVLAFTAFGLYRSRGDEMGLELRRITSATSTLFGLVLLVSLGTGLESAPFLALTCTWLPSLFLLPAGRALASQLHWLARGAEQRVLILGDGEEGHSICYWLKRRRDLGLVPVGPLDGRSDFEVVERIARAERAAHLIVTPSAAENSELIARLEHDLGGFEHVTIVPHVASLASLSAERSALGGTWGVVLRAPHGEPPARGLKRGVDLFLTVPLLVLGLPVVALIALCIKLVSRGPVLFSQPRIGLGGKEFRVHKLRSMRLDADEFLERHLRTDEAARREWEQHFKLEHDPRLLPFIGSFLRKTSLDELPQLVNVLRGEMSLVGPRPLPPYHLAKLPAEFCLRRESVLPGLTGLWQITERDGSPEAIVRLDDCYLRHRSIWLDLRIIAKTAWAVLRGRGAH